MLQSLCLPDGGPKYDLTDIGEDSKLVHRRKRSKVKAAPPRYFLLFFPSDEYDSVVAAESKILAFNFERFSLYRLNVFFSLG